MRKFLIALFIFSEIHCLAQETAGNNSSQNDFDKDSIPYYKRSKEFDYMKYLDSLLKQTKDLAIDTFSISRTVKPKRNIERKSFSTSNSFLNNPSLTKILWALALFFICFILYRLFFTNGFFRREKIRHRTQTQQEEEISDPSFYDKLIAKATSDQNYRLAIRYLYLQTLQILNQKELIHITPDKTNYEYVRELTGRNFQNDFSGITLEYEYVWYGRFEIGKEIYQRLASGYRSFQQKI